jgi:hypothetical protein
MSLIIERAASTSDGSIKRLNDKEISEALAEAAGFEGTLCKFTPASGAASRMFKPLFGESQEIIKELKAHTPIDFSIPKETLAATPKGLLPFHKYAMFVRTPLEEHLAEGAYYAKDKNKNVKLYFTVSEEHLIDFAHLYAKFAEGYSNRYNCRFTATFTTQDHSTDATAYTEDGKPFIKADGTILTRPAGHGALLTNLNLCTEDFIFIKNIDNVVKEPFLNDTAKWKKILLGRAISLRKRMVELADDQIESFLKEEFCISFAQKPDTQTLRQYLNRPLRVCGMVKNEGEPGGGPFICREKDGSTSLQILESVQIEDKSLMKESTHFNPVDIVCCIKDKNGNVFDLQNFVDKETGLKVEKNFEGRTAKYTELPGLWNGSMSRWNTQFVEVPLSTFNPVKTVTDLLRPAHQ